VPNIATNDYRVAISSRARVVANWIFTLIVAWEMVAGSLWDLLRIEYVRVVLTHLGYPLYLLMILGAWKLTCAVVLLLPRFPRLKEWAYAGFTFARIAAIFAHYLAGERATAIEPVVLLMILGVSYFTRPANRRLMREGRAPMKDFASPSRCPACAKCHCNWNG